jgi:hypothetical protein
MDVSLAREVRERAGQGCEYCRMPQRLYPAVPFPIDCITIIARQHGGTTLRTKIESLASLLEVSLP